jgi:hypothetical protein
METYTTPSVNLNLFLKHMGVTGGFGNANYILPPHFYIRCLTVLIMIITKLIAQMDANL